MNEFEQEQANDLFDDFQDRQAEDHVLRAEEELRRKAIDGYRRTTHDFAVALADAAYRKHGNYPAALIDVCSALVMFQCEKAINDLFDVVHRGKAEENTSPF